MFKINDHLVYKKDVCLLKEIKNNPLGKEVYVLEPLNDQTLTITIPKDNKFIRKLISKKEMKKLIEKIPEIEPLDTEDKLIENEYKRLLLNNNHEDLIKIIKTTYLRNKERLDNNKKIGEKDDSYLKLAETFFYTEVAVTFNIDFEKAKEYVINKVNNLTEVK